MTGNEARKDFMLGLIYPAVLGTVFYAVLAAAIDPILSGHLNVRAFATVPWLKWTLVVSTLGFYCCDYLYVMFTREFRPLFFIFDMLLLAGLYATFRTIDIGTYDLPHAHVIVVARCYVFFIILYLVWDALERLKTANIAERQFYRKIIFWEVTSLVLLLAWLRFASKIRNESYRADLLALLLVCITIWFAWLVPKKRMFHTSADVALDAPR